jgi:hypothetical protein
LIGETMFVTFFWSDNVWTRLATVAENVSSLIVVVLDWMRTLSRAGILKPALSRICAARRDSPFAICQSFISLGPTRLPRITASTANAIQPNAAVFQCAALQRPARPARFVLATTKALSVAKSSPLYDRPWCRKAVVPTDQRRGFN